MAHINQKNIRTVNLNSVGLFLFYIYIFFSYLANDVILPSSIGSLSLYLFLGYSLVYTVFIRKKVQANLTMGWMALFMAFSLLSMLYSPEKSILGGTFYTLIVNFIMVFFLSQYTITMETVERIGWAYAFSAAALIVLLILTGNLADYSESDRLGQELLGNANILATMLMISALYTIWMLVYSKQKLFGKVLLILCFVAEYFGLFLSGGRKYIIVPVIFWYLLLLFKQDSKGRKHIIKYTVRIAVVVVLILIMIMKIPMFYNTIGVRMEAFFSFLKGDVSNADGSSIVRDKMIQIGLKEWLKNPVVGYGFDSFKYYNQIFTGHFYYSHNNFVEMLFNTGIIGFILYYWYYLYTFRTAWKKKKTALTSARALSIAFVVAMLAYEYGAINYTATPTMILFCLTSVMLKFEKDPG